VFGKEKIIDYCSWAPSIVVLETRDKKKQLKAAFLALFM
jgi:hypothetical protein